MKLWYKIVEKNETLLFNKDVTENQHTVKVQTQKGICATVTAISRRVGEHKYYSHVLTCLSSTNTKHISGE